MKLKNKKYNYKEQSRRSIMRNVRPYARKQKIDTPKETSEEKSSTSKPQQHTSIHDESIGLTNSYSIIYLNSLFWV